MNDQVRPYPEWRLLWERYGVTVAPGDVLTYEELTATMGGLSARHGRGYRQLRKFFREVESVRGLQFELRLRVGYECVPIREVRRLMIRQGDLARRRLHRGRTMGIAAIKSTEADDRSRAEIADILARMSRIHREVGKAVRDERRLVASQESRALAEASAGDVSA